MTALRSWNQGVSWVAFTLTKHIQYSRLTHVSCVGVMDQYLLIRATLCVASLKIWWASWARVIIAVFSVNHASGARSPLTAGLRRTDEPAERQTADTQTERQVRPASGDFVKHWWMGYYDDTTNYLKFWFQTNFVSINLFSESYHLIQLLLVRLRLHIWNSIHAAIHGLS